MLQNTFKTAEQLGLQPSHYDALCEVLFLLESEKLPYHYCTDCEEATFLKYDSFNMDYWRGSGKCGTIACIGGWAEVIIAKREAMTLGPYKHYFNYENYPPTSLNKNLWNLFYPATHDFDVEYNDITGKQAAEGLRNYLTTGNAKWNEVLNLNQETQECEI